MAPQTIPEIWAAAVRERPRPDCFACKDRQGNYKPLSTADAFLAHVLPPLLRIPSTAVFVVFDEGNQGLHGRGGLA